MTRSKKEDTGYAERLAALEKALELAEGRLPAALELQARQLVQRATERRRYSADHTVVAFVGATGSGKSSLLNALAGKVIARSAPTRPTTSQPLALLWNPAGSEPLLEWLGVRERHEMSRDKDLDGLILLDLPDFDSTEESNRAVVDRLVGMVDVVVWVMDPQKYADAAIHQRYIQPWATKDAVTVVVLNQVDRLRQEEIPAVVSSLKEVLRQDGLEEVRIFPVSALKGTGVPELRNELARIATAHRGAVERWSNDVRSLALTLEKEGAGPDPRGIDGTGKQRLARDLALAAGIDPITSAAAKSYRKGAASSTGWPVTRWLGKLRPDPLKRLNLNRTAVASELTRTSLPPMSPVQKAGAQTAVRNFVDRASEGAAPAWRESIRRAGLVGDDQLQDSLDQAVARTPIVQSRKPVWWRMVNALQYLALLTALVGVGWLVVATAFSFFQLGTLVVPKVEGFPVPTLLLAAGVLLGILTAVLGRLFGAWGARRRSSQVRRSFEKSIGATADTLVVRPVDNEVRRLQHFKEAVRAARR